MSVRWMRDVAVAAGRSTVADRGALMVTGFFQAIAVLVLGGLWKVAADANGGDIAGYSGAALVWYIAASEAAFVHDSPRVNAARPPGRRALVIARALWPRRVTGKGRSEQIGQREIGHNPPHLLGAHVTNNPTIPEKDRAFPLSDQIPPDR